MQNFHQPQTELETFILSNWETALARSAQETSLRVARARRWENGLETVRDAALIVGTFLIVQFPFACVALEAIKRNALEYCALL